MYSNEKSVKKRAKRKRKDMYNELITDVRPKKTSYRTNYKCRGTNSSKIFKWVRSIESLVRMKIIDTISLQLRDMRPNISIRIQTLLPHQRNPSADAIQMYRSQVRRKLCHTGTAWAAHQAKPFPRQLSALQQNDQTVLFAIAHQILPRQGPASRLRHVWQCIEQHKYAQVPSSAGARHPTAATVRHMQRLVSILYEFISNKEDFNGSFFRSRNKNSLREHMRVRHIQVPEVCSICGKMSANKKALMKHKKFHFAEAREKFKCTVCGRGFRDSTKLKVHIPDKIKIKWKSQLK